MHKVKTPSKVHSLTRSIIALFGIDRRNETLKNHPDIYYKHVYFPKQLYDGIELIAAIERVSKKQAAELLLKAGISRYIGEKITKYIEDERAARELNRKVKITRFVLELRKLARERGMDISRFI